MGDITEMMLDGTLCQGCGGYVGPACDYPRSCPACAREDRSEKHKAMLAHHQVVKKVPCEVCGKKVKKVGMADHQRDAHGVTK
jgi:hypothetical protein